ncbi:tetratricopeptide repeat protein [PVC group bacterium]|nr:tetratricopeptide repeat protein [PVC group bacterium]
MAVLREEISKKDRDVNKLSLKIQQIEKAKIDLKILKDQYATMDKEKMKITEDKRNFQTDLLAAQKANNELSGKVQDQSEKFKNLDRLYQMLVSETGEIKAKNKELNHRLDMLFEEKRDLTRKVRDQDLRLKNTKIVVAGLEEAEGELERMWFLKVSDVNNLLEQEKKTSQDLLSEKTQMSVNLNKMTQDYFELKDANVELEGKYVVLLSESKELEQSIVALDERQDQAIAGQNELLNRIEERHRQQKLQSEQEIASLRRQIEEVTSDLVGSEQKVQMFEFRLKDITNLMEVTRKENSYLKGRIDRLNIALKDRKNLKAHAVSKKNELDEPVHEPMGASSKESSQIKKELAQQIESYQQQGKYLSTQIAQMRRERLVKNVHNRRKLTNLDDSPTESGLNSYDQLKVAKHIDNGNRYLEKEDFNTAMREFYAATKLDPLNIGARINLGVAYLKKKMYSSAISEFRKATKIDPQNVVAYKNLGLAYYKLNNYSLAVKNLEIALKINPNDTSVLSGLDVIHGKTLNASEADSLLDSQIFDEVISEN